MAEPAATAWLFRLDLKLYRSNMPRVLNQDLNPSSSNIQIQILQTGEDQNIFCHLINLLILATFPLYYVLILLGENRFWTLSGL